MTSYFVPQRTAQVAGTVRRPAVRQRARAASRTAWCVLATIVLLEITVLFFPQHLRVSPLQAGHVFRQATGYTLLSLMVFAMGFGMLRRLPSLAQHQRTVGELHQFVGLVFLVLLAGHVGQQPAGFLLVMFHAVAVAFGAGALRAALGTRIGRAASAALLVLHIALCCLVAGGALLHLYFVYAYTA